MKVRSHPVNREVDTVCQPICGPPEHEDEDQCIKQGIPNWDGCHRLSKEKIPLFIYCNTGDEIQDLRYVRQAFCHLVMPPLANFKLSGERVGEETKEPKGKKNIEEEQEEEEENKEVEKEKEEKQRREGRMLTEDKTKLS